MKTMLSCGHAANATDGNGQPSCAICAGILPVEIVSTPDLTGRIARCAYGCGAQQPSSMDLAFFEFRGDGSRDAIGVCKCGWGLMAHTPEYMRKNVKGNQLTVVEQGKCQGFEPRGGQQFDLYYCGCRGWD